MEAYTLKRLIAGLQSQKKTFALWFLPENNQINLVFQDANKTEKIATPLLLEKKSGFVFYPFANQLNQTGILIKPEKYLSGDMEFTALVNEFQDETSIEFSKADENLFFIEKEDYLKQCQLLIDKIESDEAEKIVYSRLLSVPAGQSEIQISDLFLTLKEKYSKAFSYLFFSPETGFWMGASPETLLQKQKDTFVTMALAGTRKIPESRMNWPEKDVLEQKYVSNFIIDKLEQSDIQNYKKSRPRSFPAGEIEHLRTVFEIPASEMEGKEGLLIEALHPTPATCGQPKMEAYEIINKTEKHNREYYTGFLGSFNLENETALFVNLRCMKIHSDKFVLYVGGGLTIDSKPELEWQETKMKSQTVLSVIEKL